MKVTRGDRLGQVSAKPKRAVANWRAHPENTEYAIVAAAHYARKDGKNRVVIPGSSFMRPVNFIGFETEDLGKYKPGTTKVNGWIVDPSGAVYEAELSDRKGNPGPMSDDKIKCHVKARQHEGWRAPRRGGLADGRTADEFKTAEVVRGLKVELEHTDDTDTALAIAMDHLVEDRDYYRKLATIEKEHNPSSGMTLIRVTPTSWIGSGGPKEAYFLFRGDRLVDVVEVPLEDVAKLIDKGYPRDADLELDVRPGDYKKLLRGRHANPNALVRLAGGSEPNPQKIVYRPARALNPWGPRSVSERTEQQRIRNMARRLARGESR